MLKEPGNAWWNELRVQGHRTPVRKLEVYVGGRWTEATRQPYNYWRVGSGDMGQAPWRVRVTDVLGKTIETSINTTTAEQSTSSQFPVCQ
ncbi:hypothetical protein [Sorangium sp. So ce693]|uniref:hypothetical protein n=1 Tax=Sorangium sp. So ce693 TaxID=3133318 RepID=UPI003F600F66